MKRMFLFVAAMVFMLPGLRAVSSAVSAPTEVSQEKIFFSPIANDFTCCSVAIQAQEDRYEEAKNNKDWEKARKYALYPYVRAWLYYNEAMNLMGSSGFFSNLGRLQKMDELFNKAEASQPNKSCQALINRNQAWVESRISKLTSKTESQK